MPSSAGFLRSQLFVPANRSDFLHKAANSGADGVILDLEDSVAPRDLPAARAAVGAAVISLSKGQYVSIRVNKRFDLLVADLDAAVSAKPDALVLPKIESAVEIAVISALVEEREIQNGIDRGSIEFQVLVESSIGLANACQIADCPRVASVVLGAEDLAAELEIEPGGAGFDLRWAHGKILMAARAAGVVPFGLLGSLSNFGDLDAFDEDVKNSRGFGYVGAFCIHPVQVPILNSRFSPTVEEVARANEVLQAMRAAELAGSAAARVGGRMVDTPVAKRAELILKRACQYESEGQHNSGR